jgi:hypothetical protein
MGFIHVARSIIQPEIHALVPRAMNASGRQRPQHHLSPLSCQKERRLYIHVYQKVTTYYLLTLIGFDTLSLQLPRCPGNWFLT